MTDGLEAVNTLTAAPLAPAKPHAGQLAPPWKPGQSGNPGGWAGPVREAQRIARENSPAAMRKLVKMLEDPDSRVAVVAANSILDRAMGKPKEAVTERDGGPPLDLSGLTAAELAQMRRLLEKAGSTASKLSD